MEERFAQYLLRKTTEDYDHIASDFSATRAFPWAEMKDLVDDYVHNGERVLDAGCGNGRLYELLKDKHITYEGIDSSEKLIEIAIEKYGDYFKAMNLVDLSGLPRNAFSVIFCIATLQHIPSDSYRLQILKEFNRLLLPDSYLVMINWNIVNQEKFKPYLKDTAKQKALDQGDILLPWKARKPEIIYRYYHGFSEEELVDLLLQSDFDCEEQYYTKHGEKVSAQEGYNIVTIARKK